MECIKIPFRSKTNDGTSFRAVGKIYLNNDFIVKQEVEIIQAFISTRILKKRDGKYKVKTKAYNDNIKKSAIRKKLLGDQEWKIPGTDKLTKTVKLDAKHLKVLEKIINLSSTGTLLSTMNGLLAYTSPSGSNKNVNNTPIVVDGGIYDGYRFYNLINNEFNKSIQTVKFGNDFDKYTIEEWVNKTKTNKMMFSLYNFEKEKMFLLQNNIDYETLYNKTYAEILSVISLKAKKENIPDIINLHRRDFKRKVMRESKYKLDFVFNDTKKENTEAAHIYEVHTIKKVESLEEWNLISDVNNCLLLTPSVHKAWDKEQIDITEAGKILNLNMEPKRFERLFNPVEFKLNFKLSEEQKYYLRKRHGTRSI